MNVKQIIYFSAVSQLWGGAKADHSLKVGSGGFEVKIVDKKGAEEEALQCRVGWTVKEWNEAIFCYFESF